MSKEKKAKIAKKKREKLTAEQKLLRRAKIKKEIATWSIDICFIIVGALLYGISVAVFTAPNKIAPGGVTGIATLLEVIFGTPIGTTALILNIPLLIWATCGLGFKFLGKTIIATILSSLSIDFVEMVPGLPKYTDDPLLAALFGGVVGGIGLAMVLSRGATTGGTDIIARMMNKYLPHFSMGKLLLAIDGMVVLASAIVYRNIASPLYAIVTIFVITKVIDGFLHALDSGTGKFMFIITQKEQEITKAILTTLDRGVTITKSQGGYSGNDISTLFCAVKPNQVNKIYEIVKGIDEKAFTVVVDAQEVSGEGWREWKQD